MTEGSTPKPPPPDGGQLMALCRSCGKRWDGTHATHPHPSGMSTVGDGGYLIDCNGPYRLGVFLDDLS